MTNTNELMKAYLATSSWRARCLPDELKSFLKAGFVELGEAIVFKKMAGMKTNASFETFPDLAGYECWYNTIHLDWYVARWRLDFALLFMDAFFVEWDARGFEQRPTAIVIGSGKGAARSTANFRFHVTRPGEHWLKPDLSGYRELVLVSDRPL